jgi:preprotein translocase subunit SecD
VIQERISGGSAVISGSFTDEEARDLAIVLRAGALPAPVKILEERTVGPSLGRDSIRAGIAAIIVGGIVVLIFMVVYYGLSGFLADLALVLNLVIIMGVLAGFGATLTLPGIAGLILTVGMAVDANVLVFERIREELRLGKTIRAAVDQGYGRAFLTILDANVTTLIAALVLLQFGTGPVRGFAITLSVGILASMFTAVFVTRVVFDRILSRREVRALSI